MTAQEVIKSFMSQLVNHGYSESTASGEKMLDAAIRASSRYNSIQEVIDAMEADQIKAEKQAVKEILGESKLISKVDSNILSKKATEYNNLYKKSNIYIGDQYDYSNYGITVEDVLKERKAEIFLTEYCGIQLYKKFWFNNGSATAWNTDSGLTGNEDTGAITGSDAGGSETKTAQSVVPEIFINTYVASTSTAQNIITNDRNWVVQATDADDTITANGADSINACAGNDKISVKGSGATITSGEGNDKITIAASVNDITLSDLNSNDALTINGNFEIGSAQIEDNLLVITDKTGKRKIRLGDFTTAKNAKVNSTTIGKWLTDAGINLDKVKTVNYSDGKVSGNSNVVENANVSDSTITVNLANVNTDAAGKVTVDGVVVGNLSSTFPDAATFTYRGLTVHLLGTTSDTSGGTNNIKSKTLDELTDDQRTIVAGLFKWWVEEGLKLVEESYGISFNSSTATIKDIGLFFYDSGSNNGTLAETIYFPRSFDGAATQLMLKINMNYFKGIASDNLDGESSANIVNVLDRTLAHEFTHAIMYTNINYVNQLPQFIIEGTAELTPGIDDERGNRIFAIASDSSRLGTVLDLSNKSTGNADFYAGGYMFLRYYAKQAAEETLPAFGEISATVNPNKSGSYYISGKKNSETATTTAQTIKLGTVSNGVYTIEDTGVHQVIINANNLKIVGLTVNDTLIGGDGADIVETSEGTFINTGNGADSIKVIGQFATIDTGADNDTVNVEDGGHHNISLGAGDDFIKIKQKDTYNDSVIGGAGDDSIIIDYSSNEGFIEAGSGNDTVYFGGQNNTISTGAGNDSVNFHHSNDSENNISLGAGDDKVTIQGESNTVNGGAGDDLINNRGDKTVFEYKLGDGNDSIEGFNSTSTLKIGNGTGNYKTVESGSDIIVTVGDGNITLKNAAKLETVQIEGVYGESLLITGTSGADKINNTLDGATIQALAGKDTIENSGSDVLINAGAGNDLIYNRGDKTVFEYKSGDGNDSIEGFNSTSTLKIGNGTGTYSTQVSGSDIIVTVGDGNITLKNAAKLETVQIEGVYGETLLITGTNGADKINNTLDGATIQALAGNDTIENTGSDVTIYGGKGNDTFVYGGGRNLIADYTKSDKISVGSAYENYSVSGSDLVFNFGDNNSLTIADGAGKVINMNSVAKIYTADGVFDSKNKSVTLSADTKKFDGSKKSALITIDGSAASKINIVGNKKANKIYAGAGNSTLTGGKGNDTLYGGDGADIFIYNKNEGKDILYDFGDSDAISLSSNATIKSFGMKNKDAILKIGSGSITVKNKSEFKFIEGSTEKIFIDGNIADTDKVSVTLSSSYKGTFKLGDYETADGSLTKKSVTLSGNDADNYLIGGKGKNSINGGKGNDTLWGGKGNDTLYGGSGDDIFIYRAGEGTDVIADYQSGDMLQILTKKGKEGTFKKATFKGDDLTLTINGGGKVIFKNVSDATTFNINGDSYYVSDKSLTK